MRRTRSVTIGPKLPQLPQRVAPWERRKAITNGYEVRRRRGDKLYVTRVVTQVDSGTDTRQKTIIKTRVPALVDWDVLLKSVRISEDPAPPASSPWEDNDGWQHGLYMFAAGDYRDDKFSSHRCFKLDGSWHILLVDPVEMGLPDYDYYHAQGASKQVARQLAAQALRRAISQLKTWYVDSWTYYLVACEFGIYGAFCHGVDDETYARDYIAPELAEEVASQLEDDGYLIVNKPSKRGIAANKLEMRRTEYRRRLNQFNIE